MTRAILPVGLVAGILGLCAPSRANLIINGGFEQPVVTNSIFFSSMPGWTKIGSSRIEIQNDFVMTNNGGAFRSAEGAQHIELDGDSSYSIYQDIATTPGGEYLVSFSFAARVQAALRGYTPADNILGFYWGGSQIDTLTADGTGLSTPDWQRYTYRLTATGSTTRIQFADLGFSDSHGTWLDGVSVTAVPEPCSLLMAAIGIGAACLWGNSKWRATRKI